MADVNDWNKKIIAEFRGNGGRVGGQFEGAPLLILHTRGARSGEPRENPVMYLEQDGHTYVFASYAGSPKHPAWYHNLKANPSVEVEVAGEGGTIERYAARAVDVTGADRDRVYARQAELYPGFAEYEEKTDRVIPVVALERE